MQSIYIFNITQSEKVFRRTLEINDFSVQQMGEFSGNTSQSNDYSLPIWDSLMCSDYNFLKIITFFIPCLISVKFSPIYYNLSTFPQSNFLFFNPNST